MFLNVGRYRPDGFGDGAGRFFLKKTKSNLMQDIFYSSKDGFLFWVAGYTADGNTDVVVDQIKSLKENAEKFAQMAGVPIESVNTLYVGKSQRYKYMRVFYVKIQPTQAIKSAFQLGEGWTMLQWLEK